jgi:glycosyltransferase involved in cell wall biosynthesis
MESLYELSIVIPVYNVELYIEQCINNLICDNIPIDYEIIIVNDGSTDSSRNIIINIIDKNSDFNIKLLDKDNGGLSSARNYGLNFAKGRYIFFLDSDDFININDI